MCQNDHAERVLSSFAHQIQSKYYVRNIFVSIEEILLDKFSASEHPLPLSAPQSCTRHDVFRSFF